MQYIKALLQAALSEQDTPAAFSIDELRCSQEEDLVIESVLSFVLGGQPPPK